MLVIAGEAPKTVAGVTVSADNTIVKAIHLLMVLMVIFLLSYDKSQEFFESYYPEMRTFA